MHKIPNTEAVYKIQNEDNIFYTAFAIIHFYLF